jgi:protein-tyrosine phosphatase
VIDLHSHVLAGVDDGAATIEESVAIARASADEGVRVLAATPHVRDDYPTGAATMERLVDELRAIVAEVEIVRGGELALDFLPRLPDGELARFGLGGSRALLLETPYYGWPLDIDDALFGFAVQGFTLVLAHPERNADVRAQPERLRPLVESGTLVQLTAASVDGRIGRSSRATAFRLLELGLAHLVASDAHAPSIRQIGMSAAAEAIGDDALARWLTVEVPAALLEDERVPRRPNARRRRRRLPFLRH